MRFSALVLTLAMLERNADQIRRSIRQKIELYRSQLEEQYSVVFGALGALRQPEGVQ